MKHDYDNWELTIRIDRKYSELKIIHLHVDIGLCNHWRIAFGKR